MIVNEIFYSLQGEGHFCGKPAVFIRFSGCNLKCSFCDTNHQSGKIMDVGDILEQISQWPTKHVVLTGGEPALQVTSELIDALHEMGYYIQVETNGTIKLPEVIDWITCSPKTETIQYTHVDELKLVFTGDETIINKFNNISASDYRLQPCDTGNRDENLAICSKCIEYIKRNPRWSLSLQTHKVLNIR
ncbi:MAG: 7-carboxy-7-deazaguanine synthase QueE [Muribaculum sp.]|nr:7-carboxy-7-deazaguanine synthase QueE [Muribaculaceae bacterium]MCM1081048.1 7-carboxy-7-deazaguanine synthase QueE [Muribaculum sp.]